MKMSTRNVFRFSSSEKRVAIVQIISVCRYTKEINAVSKAMHKKQHRTPTL